MLDRFITDQEVNLASSAIAALMIADQQRAREAALRLLSRGGFMSRTATAYLAKETRAIPILLGMINDPSPDAKHEKCFISQGLAEFGEAGVEALVNLAHSSDVSLRQIAVHGLMYCRGQPVHEVLEALAQDSNPEIRQSASIALQVVGPRRRGR
jgi:HEAT repeat protein